MKSIFFKAAVAFFALQCAVLPNSISLGFADQDPIDQEEEQLKEEIQESNVSENQELNRFAGLAGEIKAGESEEAQLTQAENQREQDDMMDAEEHDEDVQDLIDDRLH